MDSPTDIFIVDGLPFNRLYGLNYHRIQVKTVEASGEDHLVENRWKDSNVDVVVFFARNSTWGGVYNTCIYSEQTEA